MTHDVARPGGSGERSAVVVGSGPNGLAAAVVLARAGLRVTVLEAEDEYGGGTRSAELTLPGLVHDHCSAVHPLGAGSPFFRTLPLAEHGLVWRWPEVDMAHPLDDDAPGVLLRDIEATCAGLGRDGAAWRRVLGPIAAHFDDVADDILGPVLHMPRHPLMLARFGMRAGLPATVLARVFRTPQARALLGGSASHSFQPLDSLGTAAVGLLLNGAAHAFGWPVAEGGSAAIARALVSLLESHGGEVVTGHRVRTRTDLRVAGRDPDVVMLDTTPGAAADILGDDMPPRVSRAYRRFRHGAAAFKVDLAVRGGVPWRDEVCTRAGTVHLGGTIDQIAHAEAQVNRGEMPEAPFVLVAQQSVADPTRARDGVHPVWAYAHVPARWEGDGETAILDQLERFAPGVRDRIVGSHVSGPAAIEQHDANMVGGDIGGGVNDVRGLLLRPRPTTEPYDTGVPGAYLCSSSTPPGGGVHGMCGFRAATRALAAL